MLKYRLHLLALALIVVALLISGRTASAQQQPAAPLATITVNADTDQGDPYTADGLCDICNNPTAFPPVGPCNVCTLRAAIQTLNAGSGAGVIAFANTPLAIHATADLPWVSRPVTIDGDNQVMLTNSVLTINGGASTVQRMIFDQQSGVSIAYVGGNTIQNNTIRTPCFGIDIYASADNNTIHANTIISATSCGSSGSGIGIRLSSSNNEITDNVVTGGRSGMLVFGENNRIAGNLLTLNREGVGIAFGATGLWLGGSNNTVQGNRIGTDGSQALGNGTGIYVWGGAVT